MIAPRLLLPGRWFSGDAGRAGYDLFQIKERYTTVGYEMIALRLLDLDEPCIIAIVDDDGTVAAREVEPFSGSEEVDGRRAALPGHHGRNRRTGPGTW